MDENVPSRTIRARLGKFRVTAEEFERIEKLCRERGARNHSDFIRELLLQTEVDQSAERLSDSIERLGRHFAVLKRSLIDVSDLIRKRRNVAARR
jgi:hypothetical protein